MISKPRTKDGYSPKQAQRVRVTYLYLATKIGDLLEDVVVVGGLVPTLIVPQKADRLHVGTVDLDVGLSIALFDGARYAELASRLAAAGFEPDVNENGNPTRQRWRIDSPAVTVDFLIEPTGGEKPGTIKNLTRELAAFVIPGVRLAFRDRRRITLDESTIRGELAERALWVCGPGAFVAMKSLALGLRGENKDAYDLVYMLTELGTKPSAASFAPLLDDEDGREARENLRRDFKTVKSVGPLRAAEFTSGGVDDALAADAWAAVQELLAELGRA